MPSLYANSWNEKGNAWSRLANVLKLLHFFSQPQSLILQFCVIIAFFFLCFARWKKKCISCTGNCLIIPSCLVMETWNVLPLKSLFLFFLRLQTKKGDRNGWNLLSSKTAIVLFRVLVYFVLGLTGFFCSLKFWLIWISCKCGMFFCNCVGRNIFQPLLCLLKENKSFGKKRKEKTWHLKEPVLKLWDLKGCCRKSWSVGGMGIPLPLLQGNSHCFFNCKGVSHFR